MTRIPRNSITASTILLVQVLLVLSCSAVLHKEPRRQPQEEVAPKVSLVTKQGAEYDGWLLHLDNDSLRIRYLNNRISNVAASNVARIDFASERPGDHWVAVEDINDSLLIELIAQHLGIEYKGTLNPSRFFTLFKKAHLQINADSSSTITYRVISKVVSRAGAEKMATQTFEFLREQERLQVDFARVITPDGRVQSINNEAIEAAPIYPQYPCYDRLNTLSLSLPGVEAGGIIDYSVTVVRSKFSNHAPLTLRYLLQKEEPILQAAYIVTVSENVKLRIVQENMGKIDNSMYYSTKDDGKNIYHWQFSDIHGCLEEPMMPPTAQLSPQIFISTATEQTVLEAFSTALSPAKQVHLPADLTDVGDLYNFVLKNISIIPVPLVNFSHYPNSTEQTIAHKAGNELDRTYIASAFLTQMGISNNICFAASSKYGSIPDNIIAPQFFDRTLLKVYEGDSSYFISFDDELRSFKDIPIELEGGSAIELMPDKIARITIPFQLSNGVDDSIYIKLDGDGNAELTRRIRYSGENARKFRKFRDQREENIQSVIQVEIKESHPYAQLVSYELEGLDDLQDNCDMEIIYTIDHYCEEVPEKLLSLGLPELDHAAWHPAVYNREQPIFQEGWAKNSNSIIIEIPPNFSIYYYPPDTSYITSSLSYEASTHISGSHIIFNDVSIRKANFFDDGNYSELQEHTDTKRRYNNEFVILEKEH